MRGWKGRVGRAGGRFGDLERSLPGPRWRPLKRRELWWLAALKAPSSPPDLSGSDPSATLVSASPRGAWLESWSRLTISALTLAPPPSSPLPSLRTDTDDWELGGWRESRSLCSRPLSLVFLCEGEGVVTEEPRSPVLLGLGFLPLGALVGVSTSRFLLGAGVPPNPTGVLSAAGGGISTGSGEEDREVLPLACSATTSWAPDSGWHTSSTARTWYRSDGERRMIGRFESWLSSWPLWAIVTAGVRNAERKTRPSRGQRKKALVECKNFRPSGDSHSSFIQVNLKTQHSTEQTNETFLTYETNE